MILYFIFYIRLNMQNEMQQYDRPMKQDRKTFVGVSMPISILDKLDDYQYRNRIRSRSETIIQMVEAWFYLQDKIGMVKQFGAEDLDEIRKQLETGQLVDWIAHMDRKKFEILVNIVMSEAQTRDPKKK